MITYITDSERNASYSLQLLTGHSLKGTKVPNTLKLTLMRFNTLSLSLSVCLFVCLSGCLPACLPACLAIYLSIYLSESIYLFTQRQQKLVTW